MKGLQAPIPLAVLWALFADAALAAEAVLADAGPIESASLVGFEFDGEVRQATLRVEGMASDAPRLTRWGEPAPRSRQATVWLADGSWITTDRRWSPLGLVRVDGETVRLRFGEGWVEAPRSTVRAITLTGAAPLDEEAALSEVVLLSTGDRLAGRVEAVSAGNLVLRLPGQGDNPTIDTPLDRVQTIYFIGKDAPAASPNGCLVGLSNGSLLRSREVMIDDAGFRLVTQSGVSVVGPKDLLALVQPLGRPVRYLSDLEAVDYRHTPYLDLVWPYARDEGLRGDLAGGGRRAAKGIAMHSAARLVYALDGRASRFRADLAVADRPEGQAPGSVTFRVYLVRDGKFEPAFESDVIRGGDPAVPVDIDLTGAAALALVADYADGGDAGDDALWLDARIVDSL